LQEGIHTTDLKCDLTSQLVGTKDFASAIIERLGKKPTKLTPVDYVTHETRGRKDLAKPEFEVKQEPLFPVPRKTFDGVDLFVDYDPATGRDPARLASTLQKAAGKGFKLSMISNRGVVVWPNGHPDTFCADHWRW
jgi:isocitrate dehydrogenase